MAWVWILVHPKHGYMGNPRGWSGFLTWWLVLGLMAIPWPDEHFLTLAIPSTDDNSLTRWTFLDLRYSLAWWSFLTWWPFLDLMTIPYPWPFLGRTSDPPLVASGTETDIGLREKCTCGSREGLSECIPIGLTPWDTKSCHITGSIINGIS